MNNRNLSYKTLIKSKIIKDFKNFNEGLISSYPYNKLKELLENELNKFDLRYELSIEVNNVYLYLNITQVKNKRKLFEEIMSILNTSGYYISNWKKDETVQTDILNMLHFIQINKIELFLNKKYDFEDKSLKRYYYHVTEEQKYDKIKRIGLCPKSNSVIENHPDRIYLFDNIDSCYEYIETKKKIKDIKYIILKIDICLLGKIKLYVDPKYDICDGACYTYDNIDKITIKNEVIIPQKNWPSH